MSFEVIRRQGRARRGIFKCPHGTVQTPVFMNVGTQGAIKGAVSAFDLKEIGCQVELSNTYHLHLRPGDEVVRQMGGLHNFMNAVVLELVQDPLGTETGNGYIHNMGGLLCT